MSKILVVDDSPFALRTITNKLELIPNCELKAAASGMEAIEIIPDLVLTDNNMDGMTGVDLCGWIKQRKEFQQIFTCIFTAEKTEIIHKIQGLEHGADDYLFKDISTSELIAKVNSFLRISKLQKNLKDALEMRDRFFGFMVHELRTPLTAILGYIQFCHAPNLTEAMRTNYLEKMSLNSRRILDTVNDILEISRIESGEIQIDLSEFDLKNLVDSIIDEQEILATRKGLTIQSDFHPMKVTLDKSIVNTILTNFFNNAIKYTRKGSIRFWLDEKKGNTFQMGVTDTGSGIAAEFLPHVFEAFTREKRASKKIVGTGIGMSLCKLLVEALQGTIHVESSGDGNGATFFVNLPIHLSEADLASAPRNQGETGN